MFHFCVSTVPTVERVINKTKPSFMQIFVYLISFVRGMQDLLANIVISRSKFSANESLKKNPFVSKPISVVLKEISKQF